MLKNSFSRGSSDHLQYFLLLLWPLGPVQLAVGGGDRDCSVGWL